MGETFRVLNINWILLGLWSFILVIMAISAWYTSLTQGPSHFDNVQLGDQYYDTGDLTPAEFQDFLDEWKMELKNKNEFDNLEKISS